MRTTAGSSTGSETRSSDPRAAGAATTRIRWLEVAVGAHPEAVEAVSEILARVGYNGVAVDEPVDAPPDAPRTVKAYLLHDRAARIRVRRVRDALAHLQAFDLGPIGELSVRNVREEDWLEHWKASFRPIPVGAFLIRPTWSDAAPGDAVILSLDPGMAFGTGIHPTTQQCLRALSALDVRGLRVADVGTGSGILAIAAAKRGASKVVAVDVDELAIRAATENAARNAVAVTVARGSAADLPGRYDLVLANIVAAALTRIAGDLAAHLAGRGRLVIAGIVATEEQSTAEAFAAQGLQVAGREQDGDWVRLDLAR